MNPRVAAATAPSGLKAGRATKRTIASSHRREACCTMWREDGKAPATVANGAGAGGGRPPPPSQSTGPNQAGGCGLADPLVHLVARPPIFSVRLAVRGGLHPGHPSTPYVQPTRPLKRAPMRAAGERAPGATRGGFDPLPDHAFSGRSSRWQDRGYPTPGQRPQGCGQDQEPVTSVRLRPAPALFPLTAGRRRGRV